MATMMSIGASNPVSATLPSPTFQVNGFESMPQFTSSLKVDYPLEEDAKIVADSLSVDAELHVDKVKRNITVSGRQLTVIFAASEARLLRASVSAFLDMLALATKTIEEFGPRPIC